MRDQPDQTTPPVPHRLASYAATLLITAVVVAAVAGQAATAAGLVAAQPSSTTGSTLQDAPTVTVADRDATVGETVTVPVTLSEAPAGVAGFNLSVTTDDSTVATVVDVTVDDQYGFTDPSVDETTAVLVASDTGDEVQSGATDVRLGTVTLRAESAGTAELQVEVTQFDDDNGERVAPSVVPGTVTVGAASEQSTATATADGTGTDTSVFQTPGSTETATPTRTASPTPTRTASPTPTDTGPGSSDETPTAGATATETGTSGDGFQAVLGVLALLGVVSALTRRT